MRNLLLFLLFIPVLAQAQDNKYILFNAGSLHQPISVGPFQLYNNMAEINMLGPDDGSIVTSYTSSNKWIFTTISEPWYGKHPVSGNREFGYVANADSSYTFYTRGVDRLSNVLITMSESMFNIPFTIADKLWQSFQSGIFNFVIHNQGSATLPSFQNIDQKGERDIKPYHYYRPQWETVKKVLDGKLPLSTLSKDC